ncbi:hypothetical protein L1049_007900 [Liquidambar formosana]|uniref:UspA domain-containing protein n=1 Tax=Liquidambar formosana TaxID=63359 RepID=A0AAP0S907_LIQFO
METTIAGSGEAMQHQEQPPPSTPVAEEMKKMRMMVAIDESEESFYALKWALDRFLAYKGVTAEQNPDSYMLTIVHVQHPFQHFIYPAGPTVYATTSVIESVRKAQEENSAGILSRAVKAEALILDGDPKEVICEAAEQMHIDLLVVGSRGLGMIKRAFLGSVSDYCAHHAKCPILIVKPPKESSK